MSGSSGINKPSSSPHILVISDHNIGERGVKFFGSLDF